MGEKTVITIIEESWFEDEYDKSTFVFEKDKALSIWRVHDLMKKACLAMGYSAERIEEVFGETIYDD